LDLVTAVALSPVEDDEDEEAEEAAGSSWEKEKTPLARLLGLTGSFFEAAEDPDEPIEDSTGGGSAGAFTSPILDSEVDALHGEEASISEPGDMNTEVSIATAALAS
jgi:hypothetical protein